MPTAGEAAEHGHLQADHPDIREEEPRHERELPGTVLYCTVLYCTVLYYYQVNSSSWEFLNQEPQDKVQDKVQEVPEVQGKVLGKHPSTDSLYESEFESSSTLESAHSTHSRLHTSAVQQC